MKNFEMKEGLDLAWCPGCGNFNIRDSIIQALQELELKPQNVVFSSGIGQAAKMPQYIGANYFNGLHGRAMPVAVAIKGANPELTVIAEGGDGDMYGEGGNHFIHNVRRNPDITHLVHNNMVYGLTKGQASPTSRKDFKTGVQINGVVNEPMNPLALALVLGATFVARVFSGDKEQVKDVIKAAIEHKGYALVDIFHPCVSFNKVNTYRWYKEHTYPLDGSHDPTDWNMAMAAAMESDKFPLGVLYKKEGLATFADLQPVYEEDKTAIVRRKRDLSQVNQLIME
ncbi:2-oxoacid ferredoxin oxidoreductase [Alkalibacter rhizosphaerae]|uniref:2-oxoacid ferredoxin oxidoreductase n=1 Tax=Alkalibacter rhizosphaerae TaxID=2815577 RepID=A0A975AI40_9FIRM|nr:thiamine pyrophosphate-dependent enzyme [Alkalibacter rhizosphaerae]QSX09067.1 2-oxoacid ferredoxin oxidoreductase [Alkalibacter rhizosphaerae]